MKDFIEFVDHIESFYGKDGIYDIGVSRLDIALALGYYRAFANYFKLERRMK